MKKIKQILLFLVLVILLMGVVSSAQLQDDSAGSTDNEATKIVEKTSTISQSDPTTQTDSDDNIQQTSKNTKESESENRTIQTSTATSNNVSSSKMNSHDIMVNSNKNKDIKADYFIDLQNLIDESDGELDLEYDYWYNHDSPFTETLKISKSITINGNGHSIDGDGGPMFSIVSKDISVTFKDITFANGLSYGGSAISNSHKSSSLTIINCKFIKNSAENIYGDYAGPAGAIYTAGELNISNSYFYKNIAAESGGAIVCDNNLFVNNSVFSDNRAGINYCGGAIYCGKSGKNITIINSIFENNTVFGGYGEGGAIYFEYGNLIVNNTSTN